jgi:hypothetical protein
VPQRQRLADHAADRQADDMHPVDCKRVDDSRDVGRQFVERHVPGRRIAAAVTAHVDAQHSPLARQQCRDLLGPHAAVGRERMREADGRRALRAHEIVMNAASGEPQQHVTLSREL